MVILEFKYHPVVASFQYNLKREMKTGNIEYYDGIGYRLDYGNNYFPRADKKFTPLYNRVLELISLNNKNVPEKRIQWNLSALWMT